MSGKVNIKTVISFAGAYVATVIGSCNWSRNTAIFYVLWICGYYRWNNLYGTIFMVWSRSYR